MAIITATDADMVRDVHPSGNGNGNGVCTNVGGGGGWAGVLFQVKMRT